jgi:crotonobetainyl-CoA:carnitine CoA-transferase CaiB-like acyl-CoA transferase
MTMPLEGIRVIDWTIWQQGPVASVMLGDLGAEVIKVEERIGGDPGRGVLRAQGLDLTDRPNFYFEANNRNKKSLTVDLKRPEGVEIVRRLADGADVFVQNFRQGVAARLGIGAAALRARNPRLIYASASGYGPEGPESGAPSFDYLGLARSGIMMSAGEPDDPPLAIAGGIADQMGAVMLAYGVLAALLARERTGRGQEVDASHLGSMSWLQGLGLSARLMLGRAMPRVHRRFATNPLWNHYCCADGEWLALSMLQADRYWAKFCRAIGEPELATDTRYDDIVKRREHAADLIARFDRVFLTKPRAEWLEVLRKGGDFIVRSNSVDQLPDDVQVQANGYVTQFEHPTFGATRRRHPDRVERHADRPAPGSGVRPAHGRDPHRGAGHRGGSRRSPRARRSEPGGRALPRARTRRRRASSMPASSGRHDTRPPSWRERLAVVQDPIRCLFDRTRRASASLPGAVGRTGSSHAVGRIERVAVRESRVANWRNAASNSRAIVTRGAALRAPGRAAGRSRRRERRRTAAAAPGREAEHPA